MYRQEGFVRRTTARGADNEWLTVTLWWGSEWADRAPASSADLDDLIDAATVTVRRYDELPG